jgi:shikimate dehydrogenase
MPQYIGVIGYPLQHTLSPVFQQAALDYYNLDIHYQAWETKSKDLFPTIVRLKQPDYLGANVTTPNTIVNKEGKLAGYNTDVHGFLQALRNEALFEPKNRRAIVLGSGGSARAVCFSLIFEDIDSITIVARSRERGETLSNELQNYCKRQKKNSEVAYQSWQQVTNSEIFKDADLLVNCTTIGMKGGADEFVTPLTADTIPEDMLVYDLVYNPEQTPLLKAAVQAGAGVLNGLPMLVYQGAAAFELFIGKEPPVALMFEAAEKALHKIDSSVN